jgi:endonuclease III
MPRESLPQKISRTTQIIAELQRLYPTAHCALNHQNPFELLIATILSAQCTDVRVNLVTPALFKKYPTPEALAKAPQSDIEKLIQSTGFFRAKAKSLHATSTDIVEKHKGQVPDTMDQLTALRGVGRKTANVVLGNAFHKNIGIVVDTHVARLSLRLHLTKHTDPVKIEQDLIKIVPQNQWTLFSHWLIFHGRQICIARSPHCQICPLLPLCPTGPKILAERKKK